MNNIQELALELMTKNLSPKTRIEFKDHWFTFYIDTCGQRGHYVIPYKAYGSIVENHYVIKRELSFTNECDEGKNKAILGVLNLAKCKAISINQNNIEFEQFIIHFDRNPASDSINFVYE
jgi:hypothetical protein